MKRGGVGGWSESARLSAKKNVNVESASRNGKIMKELGLGIFSPEVEAKRKVNASKGGIANSGKQKSDEHKSKISKSLKGKQKKYPKNRKSRPMTEETREKLRQKALERNARESER